MLNKIQKLSLTDYLNDTTDIRLKIFLKSLNPEFTVTKSSMNDIKAILEDYRKDNNKSRLKLLENYVGGLDVRHARKIKPGTKISILSNPRAAEYKTLVDECTKLQRIHGNGTPNPDIVNRINEFRTKMQSMESELGLKTFDPTRGDIADPAAIAEYEVSLIKGVLGDWEKQGTFAWEILYGAKSSFTLIPPAGKNLDAFGGGSKDSDSEKTGIDHILELLGKHSGKRPRNFNVKFFLGQGGEQNNKISGWQFVELGSGLGWGDQRVNLGGESVDVSSIYAMPDFRPEKVPV